MNTGLINSNSKDRKIDVTEKKIAVKTEIIKGWNQECTVLKSVTLCDVYMSYLAADDVKPSPILEIKHIHSTKQQVQHLTVTSCGARKR